MKKISIILKFKRGNREGLFFAGREILAPNLINGLEIFMAGLYRPEDIKVQSAKVKCISI